MNGGHFWLFARRNVFFYEFFVYVQWKKKTIVIVIIPPDPHKNAVFASYYFFKGKKIDETYKTEIKIETKTKTEKMNIKDNLCPFKYLLEIKLKKKKENCVTHV